MFQPNASSRIVILGRTGSGKTVLSKTIQAAYSRVIIVDKVGDYAPDGKTHFFSDFPSFADFLLRYQRAPRLRVCYQFDVHEREDLKTAEEIFALAYDFGSCLVNCDEVQYFQNSHYLKQLTLVGRRRNIATIASTQRPANVPKDLISQASDVFIGQLFEPNDLKYLDGFVPSDAIDQVAALPPMHFLHYRPGHGVETVKNDAVLRA